MKRSILFVSAVSVVPPLPAIAFARTGPIAPPSFLADPGHLLGGLGHVLAMAAVGLWAALHGGRRFVGARGLGEGQ